MSVVTKKAEGQGFRPRRLYAVLAYISTVTATSGITIGSRISGSRVRPPQVSHVKTGATCQSVVPLVRVQGCTFRHAGHQPTGWRSGWSSAGSWRVMAGPPCAI